MSAIAFPILDPVLFEIGPFAVRWYALAYIVGILLAWRYGLYLARRPQAQITPQQFDDLLLYATLGVILGGRLGYVLFYKPGYFIEYPAEILMVWQGGMSFHGGLLGVIIAMLLYARAQKIAFFAIADIAACATPIGLFLGRLANFVNGELYGRPTELPWGIVFPDGGPMARHPSQLYEAFLEGIVLFAILFLVARFSDALLRRGFLSGLFLVLYGLFRSLVEILREPDAHLGYIGGVTMGQILSLPMILIGLLFIWQAQRRPRSQGKASAKEA